MVVLGFLADPVGGVSQGRLFGAVIWILYLLKSEIPIYD
jgi:hypothetical protein